MSNLTLAERGVKAAEKFLDRRGYEVLESRDDFVVAKEDEALVFAKVCVREGGGFDDALSDKSLRSEFEVFAIRWLMENGSDSDIPIRFDSISMIVTSDSQALLRHHINCLN